MYEFRLGIKTKYFNVCFVNELIYGKEVNYYITRTGIKTKT